MVVRGGVEPPTFRFSGVADAQLTPASLQQLAVADSTSLALVAHVAVTVAVIDGRIGRGAYPDLVSRSVLCD